MSQMGAISSGTLTQVDGGTNITTVNPTGPVVTVNLDATIALTTLTLTNPLTVQYGGTGAATLTDHGVLLGSGTSAITPTAALTNGQLVVGNTGNDPSLATLTAGTGITVTNAAGSITVASTSTTLNNQTGTTYQIVLVDSGKMVTCTNAAAITVTIPPNATTAFPIGTSIGFFQGGAGQITLSGAVPPTLKSADNAYTTTKLYSACGITKIDTDVWMVYGDVVV